MKVFEAEMRVVHSETWTVDAKDEAEARAKIEALHSSVETDDAGGEIIDWKIEGIKIVQS